MFWNGWTADKDLGSRIWNKGGLDKYPPIISRAVLLDVAGMKGGTACPRDTGSRRRTSRTPPKSRGRTSRRRASCSFAPAG
jgi:hypothetical protein